MTIKIYTKTGDKGVTGLIGGDRIAKNDIRIEAYGTVDELNSYIGLVKDLCEWQAAQTELLHIQNTLFIIGSLLANTGEKQSRFPLPEITLPEISFLENAIDQMAAQLPELKHFILPGGHPLLSHTHIARCICRRAERMCVTLEREHILENSLIVTYLNRLSDYLFILARYFGQKMHIEEIKWIP